MPWQDLEVLAVDAVERDRQQQRRDENIAMLVDREHYYLESEYSSWITDPNDPQVKAERMQRKRRGEKPPPHPLIYPVAQRAPELAQRHLAEFQRAADRYAPIPEAGEPLTVAQVLRMRKGG